MASRLRILRTMSLMALMVGILLTLRLDVFAQRRGPIIPNTTGAAQAVPYPFVSTKVIYPQCPMMTGGFQQAVSFGSYPIGQVPVFNNCSNQNQNNNNNQVGFFFFIGIGVVNNNGNNGNNNGNNAGGQAAGQVLGNNAGANMGMAGGNKVGLNGIYGGY